MNQDRAKQITSSMKALVKKDTRLNINELRVIIALERAIARLSQNKEIAEHLVFKGGFVLLKSYDSLRFTRDADALAVAISKDKLKDLVCAALEIDLNDGLWFGDIQVREITEQGEYGAYRFDSAFQIGKLDLRKLSHFSRIHIDVGFSDRLPMKPPDQIMPSVLDYTEPVSWKIYPIEYIAAEKIQTLFDRGSANSRAKDIYDLIHLFPRCKDQSALITAIKKTFENRQTEIPDSFTRQAGQFDKTVLSHAWPGVRILEEKSSFDEAWKRLMRYLKTL